jgi:hypothetical protein
MESRPQERKLHEKDIIRPMGEGSAGPHGCVLPPLTHRVPKTGPGSTPQKPTTQVTECLTCVALCPPRPTLFQTTKLEAHPARVTFKYPTPATFLLTAKSCSRVQLPFLTTNRGYQIQETTLGAHEKNPHSKNQPELKE